jgi:hypothetical protein
MSPIRLASFGAAALAVAATLPAAAQVPLTPRALGMGGAYIAVARGQESLFQNPANLGLPGSPHWSAGIPTLTLGAATRGITPSEFMDLVRFDNLSASERQTLLAGVPAGGTGVDLEVRAPLVALQVRRFAFGIGYGVKGNHTVNRSIVDLVLNGFDRAKSYSIDGTTGFRADYWDFAAAYGQRLGPVAVGATARYMVGGSMVRSGLVSVDTTFAGPLPTDLRVTYAGVRASGGSGFGLDLGAAAEPIPGLTVSLALENVVNTLAWGESQRLRQVTLTGADYEDGDPEEILSRYEDSETAYAPGSGPLRLRTLSSQLSADRDAGLPMVVRLGAAYRTGTGTTVAAAYQGETETNSLSGLWERQVSLGIQQKIPLVTLRAGVSSDLEDGSLLGGGVSLGPLQFGLARVSRGAGDEQRRGWITTIGLGGRSDSVMP